MEKKVKFGDLSLGLKVAVVFAWVVGIMDLVFFLIGFVWAVLYG